MVLREILNQLSYGELSQLKIGEMSSEDLKKVISHINLALTELYKRFWIKTSSIIVQRVPNVLLYECTRSHCLSNVLSVERYRYILDSRYGPFQDDLIKIERVFNECGELQPLNDEHCLHSFHTPSFNILHFPATYPDQTAVVEYRAAHPVLSLESDPDCTVVDIPATYLEPLLLFVGHRASRILNSDGQHVEANSYLQQYEAACQRLQNLGLDIHTNLTNTKLDQNGWV